MVHAALLLLMLEAANARPRFTISLKRSTQNLQLSTSRRPIIPSFHPISAEKQTSLDVGDVPMHNRRHSPIVRKSTLPAESVANRRLSVNAGSLGLG
jgi:hypothetical protein